MSSGTVTFILIAVAFVALFLVTNTNVLSRLTASRTRSRVPGLKKYTNGPKCGTYSIKFYPEHEAITFQSSLQGAGQTREDLAYGGAKIVVFFTSFELFHYGNGSASQDTSGLLREQVRRVLTNSGEPTWEIVEGDLYRKPLFRYDGELYRHALAVPDVLGVEPRGKDVSLVQGVKALVGQRVNPAPSQTGGTSGPQNQLVRHAVAQLLDWHEQFGPALDRAEAQDRGANAWEAALASVRNAAV